tara:strand:- start:173 stop:397 length:225 start_codon:yes stop_codon:yes gene_type:complete
VSDYIFGTLKILKRVTPKIKELITSNTSDRVYKGITMYSSSITTQNDLTLIIGVMVLGIAVGCILYFLWAIWTD